MGAGTTVGTEKGRPGNWREPAADPARPCEAPIRCEQSGSEALSSLGTFSNCGGWHWQWFSLELCASVSLPVKWGYD